MHNIKKAKRLPGTKEAKKYFGPYTVEEVKPSHFVSPKGPNNKTTIVPLHIARKYDSRNPVSIVHWYKRSMRSAVMPDTFLLAQYKSYGAAQFSRTSYILLISLYQLLTKNYQIDRND